MLPPVSAVWCRNMICPGLRDLLFDGCQRTVSDGVCCCALPDVQRALTPIRLLCFCHAISLPARVTQSHQKLQTGADLCRCLMLPSKGQQSGTSSVCTPPHGMPAPTSAVPLQYYLQLLEVLATESFDGLKRIEHAQKSLVMCEAQLELLSNDRNAVASPYVNSEARAAGPG